MQGPLCPARLDWSQGDPRAADYGDVYFSAAGGLAETCHVFLDGNDLETRFRALRHPQSSSEISIKTKNYEEKLRPFITQNQRCPPVNGDSITLIETGFGTGLNWLAAMTLWAMAA
ncbi:MAG: hypothetical protein ACK4UT_05320, partial [Moraxellaceae bacterium]